jgi:hypothetical protein
LTSIAHIHQDRDRTIWWGLTLSVMLHLVLLIPAVQDVFKTLDIELEE